MFRFVTMHAFDGQTDRILIVRPRLHSMQHGNKPLLLLLISVGLKIMITFGLIQCMMDLTTAVFVVLCPAT